MRCINVHNVNQGLAEGLRHLEAFGQERDSRNGKVWVSPTPVITTYLAPTCRVLFSPHRNANPFFHMMEALWMLAGRNDLHWLEQFNKRFREYSDDGYTIHGAYGHRWREHFNFDQLPLLVDELLRDENTRRAVLTMWDPPADFNNLDGKDVPCNTHAYFDQLDGRLNMTVCCRSNDIIWGAYGANAVHFSMLLEYLAAAVGRPVGVYRQLSNNYHAYQSVVGSEREKLYEYSQEVRYADRYTRDHGSPHSTRALSPNAPAQEPMVQISPEAFMDDLLEFMENPDFGTFEEPFFKHVACPTYCAWDLYKVKDYEAAMQAANHISADDWRIACVEWLQRREEKRNA